MDANETRSTSDIAHTAKEKRSRRSATPSPEASSNLSKSNRSRAKPKSTIKPSVPIERGSRVDSIDGRTGAELFEEVRRITNDDANPSQAFRIYVWELGKMSKDEEAEKTCWRIVLDLVKRHGTGRFWAQARPIEEYFADHGKVFKPRPAEISQGAGAEAEESNLSQEARALIDIWTEAVFYNSDLYDAEELLQRVGALHLAGLTIHPPPRPEGAADGKYLTEVLRQVAIEEQLVKYRPQWEEAIRARAQDEAAAQRCTHLWETMQQEARSGKQQPYGPTEHDWRTEWDALDHMFSAKMPTKKEQKRYADIRTVIQTQFDRYGEFIWPSEWPTTQPPPEFCGALRRHVFQARDNLFHQAWEEACSMAEEADDQDRYYVLRTDWGVALQYLRAGQESWRPGEPMPEQVSKKETTIRTGFDTEQSTFEGYWNYEKVLGEGGQGLASLWLKVDAANNILQRVVIKDCYLEPYNWENNWQYWQGDMHRRVPKEEYIARLLKECEDSDHIIRCHCHAIYELLNMFRIYSEYAPHGNLEDLIREHARLRHRNRVDETGRAVDVRLPVRAAWAIFEALTSAACLMRDRRLPDMPLKHGPHASIIHRDIKPENIFLAAPDKDFWPGIPVPKLADFGLAVFTSDKNASVGGHGVGTHGYQAPELCRYPETDYYYRQKNVTVQSDVWAIGRVMLSVLQLETVEELQRAGHFDFYSPGDAPEIDNSTASYYPEKLVGLVKRCLSKVPQNRPTIENVWKDVHREVASFMGLRGSPLKRRPAEVGEVLAFKKDAYQLLAG